MLEDDAGATFHSTERNSLVELLAFLRNRGSTLLVVGNVPIDVHRSASRQMLGTGDTAVRRRVLALTTDEPAAVTDRIPEPSALPSSSETSIISYRSPSRGTMAMESSFPSESAATHVVESGLSDLLATIYQEIERHKQPEAEAPATLRFCLESLSTLLSEHDQQLVFRFLHLLLARIRAIRAIGHVHLQTERRSEHASFVEPLFDAVVELSLDERGRPQQRWQLTAHDVDSRWLSLERDDQ